MSGSKRNSQYRKGATSDFLRDDIELTAGDLIAQVVCSKGSNLFDIRVSGGEQGLAILPNRFRNLIWIKRNDFVVVVASMGSTTMTTSTAAVISSETNGESAEIPHVFDLPSPPSSSKKFEVKEILNKGHIKQLKAQKKWPVEFDDKQISGEGITSQGSDLPGTDCNGDDDAEDYDEDEYAEELVDARGNTIIP
jgi:probable RNA-binding protein EIF1AD